MPKAKKFIIFSRYKIFTILKIYLLGIFCFLCTTSLAQEPNHSDTSLRLNLKNIESILQTKQKNGVRDTDRICLCCRPRGDTSRQILCVLKDIDTTNHFKRIILNPKTIDNIEIVNKTDAMIRFGDKGKFGAIIIEINYNTELLSLTELFEQFCIDGKYRQLPICLDDDFITESSKILADVTAIKKMEVTEGRYWFYTKQVDSPQNYINIVTKSK
jgi:hypothetical protein